MKPMFPHTGAGTSAPGLIGPPPDDVRAGSPACCPDQACCCPAQPVVRVIMPATPNRPHSVDLLLCGHHYRVSRQALAAAGARIDYLPGKAEAAESALLTRARRDHVQAI
jgi:hypothetical protein